MTRAEHVVEQLLEESPWLPFDRLTPEQKAAVYRFMVTDGGIERQEYAEHVRKFSYQIRTYAPKTILRVLASWGGGWADPYRKLHPADEQRIKKVERAQQRTGMWPYVAHGSSFKEWAADEMQHGDGWHRMVLALRRNEPIDMLFMRTLPGAFSESRSPEIKALKARQTSLTGAERRAAGEAPIKKSVVNGTVWYWSSTHRLYQKRRTVKAAVTAYWKIVEPSG